MKRRFAKYLLFPVIAISLSSCSFGEFWNKTKEVANSAVDGIKNISNDIAEFAKQTWNKTTDFFNDVGEKTKSIAEPIIKETKDKAVYVWNNVSEFTVDTYHNIEQKAKNIATSARDFLSGVNTTKLNSIPDIKYNDPPTKSLMDHYSGYEEQNPYGMNHVLDDKYLVSQFIEYSVSEELENQGYNVYNGIAYVNEKEFSGLIFSKNDTTIEYKNENLFVCGFIQIVENTQNVSLLSDEDILTGAVAVPVYNRDNKQGKEAYVIGDYYSYKNNGGVFKNQYFEITQIKSHVLNVTFKENIVSNYNYDLPLYDYDNSVVISEGVKSLDDEVNELAEVNQNAFYGAVNTANAIADIGDQLPEGSYIASTITVDEDSINEADKGSKNFVNKIKNWYDNSVFANNPIFAINKDGIKLFNKQYYIDNGKVTKAFIKIASSAWGAARVAGTAILTVVSGNLMVGAVCLTVGTAAVVFDIGKILENVQNVEYGLNNKSLDKASNPVYEALKERIGDEDLAKKVYHVWGISSSVISHLSHPVLNSLQVAKELGLNVFRSSLYVIRACVVNLAQSVATFLVSGIIGGFTSKIIMYVTNDKIMATITGLGTTLISSLIIYNSLDKLDEKLNLSGLHPKAKTAAKFVYSKGKLQTESINAEYPASDALREETVQYIAELAKKELKITTNPTIKCIYSNDIYDCGGFSRSTNTITINMLASGAEDPLNLIKTIGHEMKHSNQYALALQGNSTYLDGFNNYISPKSDFSNYDLYQNQLLEREAFNFEDDFLNLVLNFLGF